MSWKYALKAFAWARKYGLRINLDLHTMPGSQNGYNHSGKEGQINFLLGVMGLANAQRGLDYMRVIVEFISQPEYANLVPMFGVMNEAVVASIGMDVIGSLSVLSCVLSHCSNAVTLMLPLRSYLHMHDTLRNITGYGNGHGPYLSIHDGFQSLSTWADFLPGHDRLALDTHPYFCFDPQDYSPLSTQMGRPCDAWAKSVNTSWSEFGVTTAGEWSLAVNDCGYWLNGVGSGSRYEGTFPPGGKFPAGISPTGCDVWNDWQAWNQTMKEDLRQVALASMDALQVSLAKRLFPMSTADELDITFWRM